MAINFSSPDKIKSNALGRVFKQRPWSLACQFSILAACILLLHGCANNRGLLGNLLYQGRSPNSIEKNYFLTGKEDSVIGRLAVIRVEKGDTMPDIARHFSLGINGISAANPAVDIWTPMAGERVVLPLSFILPEARKNGIVINLAAMRLFYYKKDGNLQAVATYPVGVGTTERPTPMGLMHIMRKKSQPAWYVPASIAADHRKKGDPLPAMVPPGPLNPLGEYALYLSMPGYLIHGTNKPASIGLRATNGCIRLYPEDIKRLFNITPVRTPVKIVNQPYLVGWRNGMVYLEAHTPFEESGAKGLKKIYAELNKIEKKTGHAIDWDKVEKVMAETRGIPIVVSAFGPGGGTPVDELIRLRHPVELYGQPQVPDLKTDAWYVLAATLHDKVDARRLAAIINHQGPPIPARVLSVNSKHRVLAGPFNNKDEAEDAEKRLKIDLELDGLVIEPDHREISKKDK